MQSVDWVVVPSTWWENSPVVIQEAFFHGRPVIAANIGGMAEKVHDGVDGLHFRARSAEDLADRLIETLTDETLWETLRGGITPPLTHVDVRGRAYRPLSTHPRAAAGGRRTGATGRRTGDRNRDRQPRQEALMARVLVMIPSGEIYDHDCVRWYRYREIQRSINRYHNIGDAFVFDSSLKLLRLRQARRPRDRDARHGRPRPPARAVRLRRPARLELHQRDDGLAASAAVLRRLGLPVLAFGIGAQAPVKGRLNLSEESKTVFHIMSDLSTSIGVRGAYSAQVLWDIGIRNVRIIGCPTAFRNNDPNLAITLPPLDEVKRVGVTIRREVSASYARNIERYLTVHRDIIAAMADRFETVLMAQGEIEEKKIVFGTPEQREEAFALLKAEGPVVEAVFRCDRRDGSTASGCSIPTSSPTTRALVRKQDAVLGYRLHGNLMALANGVPSIYFTYDSRTTEFAETFQIPSYDVFSSKPFVLEDYWEQSLFDRFNRARFHVYREMRTFLDENGIDNKMIDVTAHPAEPVRRIA